MDYLNETEQAPIKGSFALLGANIGEFVDSFYTQLFESDSTLRTLFSQDMVEQKRKLQKMLTTIT